MRNSSAIKPPAWWHLADPYLQWADRTGFQYFRNGPLDKFAVIAELADKLDTAQRKVLESAGTIIATKYSGQRFITANLDIRKRKVQLDAFATISTLEIELAAPIASPRSPEASAAIDGGKGPTRLIGVIDDGCPFAHADLMRNGTSRVAFLWDQGATCPHGVGSGTNYGYGYYFGRNAIASAIRRGTPTKGTPDEDAVYALLGQDRLRPLASHGAHVLGLAVSSTPVRNRVSPSRFSGGDATEPPTWSQDGDQSAALAFVQIPKDALDDSSGRWLGRNILDGIHALIDYAVATTTVKRATINISYGPQTGPHDGSSLLERAIDDLIKYDQRIDELHVVVPAGNSYQSRAHAEFDLALGGGPVTWHVPPDSETPAFLEIWLPSGLRFADTLVEVHSASGLSLAAVANKAVPSPQGSWHLVTRNTARKGMPEQWVVLVALGATGGFPDAPQPPHGRWIVSVKPRTSTATGVAHAYVARNDYNFGGLRRGRPSHLWDANYDPDRFMRSREDDLPPVGNVQPAVRIRSGGSLSGLATGERTSVAAGYRIADVKPAIYSSGGPSRGKREGPDWAYPTDESRVFPGMVSWGNRSGASVRLVGTSSAAPQYARSIDTCGDVALPPTGPSKPDPRAGWGNK